MWHIWDTGKVYTWFRIVDLSETTIWRPRCRWDDHKKRICKTWCASVDWFDCDNELLSCLKCMELVDQLRNCYVCLFVCWWPVERSVSRSDSVFPNHLNSRHISHTALANLPCTVPTQTSVFKQIFSCDKKVKQTLYSPEQFLSIPAGSDSHISRQSAHKGSKVINPTHRPLLPRRNIPGTHLC